MAVKEIARGIAATSLAAVLLLQSSTALAETEVHRYVRPILRTLTCDCHET